jgi:hypothetical protein
MTAAGVNAAQPRPLPVVPCGLLRHGNANDLHVSVIVTRRETLSFPIPFTREATPSAIEQRERCFGTSARGRTVRAQGVDTGRRLPIRAKMIVEEQKRMEEARPPDWAAVPSPRTERKLLIE